MPWEARAAVFLKAADLLAGPWRDTINAATMLGPEKTCSRPRSTRRPSSSTSGGSTRTTCSRSTREQPQSARGMWNYVGVPAARGLHVRGHAVQLHVIARQPADRARPDGQHGAVEAGVERGVSRLVPDAGAQGGRPARRRHQLRAGQRRPGGRPRDRQPGPRRACTSPGRPTTFQSMWRRSANSCPATAATRASSGRPAARTSSSRTSRADVEALVAALVRGAFEYQGQKCSAASRAFIPESLWRRCKPGIEERSRPIRWARRWTSATSCARSSTRPRSTSITGYIDEAKKSGTLRDLVRRRVRRAAPATSSSPR